MQCWTFALSVVRVSWTLRWHLLPSTCALIRVFAKATAGISPGPPDYTLHVLTKDIQLKFSKAHRPLFILFMFLIDLCNWNKAYNFMVEWHFPWIWFYVNWMVSYLMKIYFVGNLFSLYITTNQSLVPNHLSPCECWHTIHSQIIFDSSHWWSIKVLHFTCSWCLFFVLMESVNYCAKMWTAQTHLCAAQKSHSILSLDFRCVVYVKKDF